MRFAIGFTEYFNAIGFNTAHWRKSVDESKALVHAEHALTLAEKSEIDIYDMQSAEFKELLASPEWTKQEYALDPTDDEELEAIDEEQEEK